MLHFPNCHDKYSSSHMTLRNIFFLQNIYGRMTNLAKLVDCQPASISRGTPQNFRTKGYTIYIQIIVKKTRQFSDGSEFMFSGN